MRTATGSAHPSRTRYQAAPIPVTLIISVIMTEMEIIDISLPIYDGMPVYPGTKPTRVKSVKSGSGTSVLSELSLTSHAGTHIDAPSHAIEAGKQLKDIGLDRFYGHCRVLDFSAIKEAITAANLKSKNIQVGERILLKTANSSRGFKEFYDDYVYLAADGAKFLAERKVLLVGIDALSVKKRGDKDNASHTALLSRDIPILEGLDLGRVEEGEYLFVALPLALQGDGAPARAVLIR